MFPVKMKRSLSNHSHKMELRILLPKAIMRPSAKYKPILGSLLSITSNPALRVESVRVRVHFRIAKGGISRRNHHGAWEPSLALALYGGQIHLPFGTLYDSVMGKF